MKRKKPITNKMKEKASRLYEFMKSQHGYVTKAQIGAYLGILDERSVRDVISLLATKKPIISTSDSKGYKLARTIDDLDEVEHTWAELSSRIEELEKRIAPLILFRDACLGLKNHIKTLDK